MTRDREEYRPFANWLQGQLKRRGWLASYLALRLGVSKTAVSQWLRAQNVPNLPNSLQLADVLGVPVRDVQAWLPGGQRGDGEADVQPGRADLPRPIAVVWVRVYPQRGSAGAGVGVDEMVDEVPFAAPAGSISGKLIGIQVSGDCMLPAIADQEIVIVDTEGQPATGKVILARQDAGDWLLQRVVGHEAGQFVLRGDNPRYNTEVRVSVHDVRGVAVGAWRPL